MKKNLWGRKSYLLSYLGILWIALVAVKSPAFSIGTKFACCRSQTPSCLGGGSSTIWTRVLADRALTQADAQLRCGFNRMVWNTHSCPASIPCPEPFQPPTPKPPQPPQPPQPPVAQVYYTDVFNTLNEDAYLVFDSRGEGFSGNTNAWIKMSAGERRRFTHEKRACFGYSINQRDRIADRIAQGLTRDEYYSSVWVHPTYGFESRYWEIINGATVWISMDQGRFKTEVTAPKYNLPNKLREIGLVWYRCIPVQGQSSIALE